MPFYLPPLRERIEDIGPLVHGMAARFNTKFCKGLLSIHPDVIAALEAFPWPGNIRQLENVVQQAVLVSTGPELRIEHLAPLVRNGPPTGRFVGRFTRWPTAGKPRSTRHPAGPGGCRQLPHPRRTSSGREPSDPLQEDEEVRPLESHPACRAGDVRTAAAPCRYCLTFRNTGSQTRFGNEKWTRVRGLPRIFQGGDQ